MINGRLLIVHADDLGYCTARDDAIFDLASRGVLSWASVLLNGKSAHEAVLRASSQRLGLALHLNLTEGPPCASGVSSLRGSDGAMLGKMGFREALMAQRVTEEDLTTEIRKQIELYLAAAGSQRYLHIDGHQHVHVLAPVVPILVRELRRTGRRFSIRLPVDRHFMTAPIAEERKVFMTKVVADAEAARSVFADAGLITTEAFIGQGLIGAASTLANLQGALQSLSTAMNVEWMVHPGFADPTYGDDFNRSPDRETEYKLLCSPEFRDCVARYGLQLGGWQEL